MPIVTAQNIVPLVVAIGGTVSSIGAAIVGIIKANKAQATADTNHAETRARLDDLENGRVPVKMTEPPPVDTDGPHTGA